MAAAGVKDRYRPIILEIKQLRGDEAEKKVRQALEVLQEDGIIHGFDQTAKFSAEDIFGIDFIIFDKLGKEILLQVKSYPLVDAEIQGYQKRGIYVISALDTDERSTIESKILGILEKNA